MNICGILFLIFFWPACGFLGYRLRKWVERLDAEAPVDVWRQDRLAKMHSGIDRTPDPVAPTPLHLHILDFDRVPGEITEAGGIYGHCCMAGCGDAFYINPKIVAQAAKVMQARSCDFRLIGGALR
jgi:hypothetical protein